MASPLENLTGPGKRLNKEPPDAKEFSGLKRSALARLTDSAKSSNSLESRFDLAYNAAHALCLAAVRWHGFRPDNRYIVFQVLPDTLGLGPEVWRVLDKCHSVRNLGDEVAALARARPHSNFRDSCLRLPHFAVPPLVGRPRTVASFCNS